MSKLTKIPLWDVQAFHAYFVAVARKPFAWGVHDCCLFAANGIQAMTGVDVAEDFRGKYHDEATAFATIKEVTGGTTVEDAAVYVANKYEMAEVPHKFKAQRGDMALVKDAGGLVVGLVHLTGRHVLVVGDKQLQMLPLSSIVRVWRVGA